MNAPFIQERAYRRPVDREVDILGDVARHTGHLEHIEFGDNHADDVAALIKYRAAAVTRLNRGRDL